jgi:DNA-binding Xre family transcriptional regulator
VAKVRIRLRELVEQRKEKTGEILTQFEIAAQTGVSLSTISRWMRNSVNTADFDTIERLCEFLNCDISDLMYLDRSEN